MTLRFALVCAALAAGLTMPPPLLAAAVTVGNLYFRMPAFDSDPFDPHSVSLTETGVNSVSMSYTSARGSQGRLSSNAAAGTVKAFAHAVNGAIGVAAGDEVWSQVYIRDYFTVNGPAAGTPVSLTAYFTVDGTLSGAASRSRKPCKRTRMPLWR